MKIVISLYRAQRRRLHRDLVKERDVEARQRYLIILSLDKGMSATEIHAALGAARSTVYRVARRFEKLVRTATRGPRASIETGATFCP